MIKVESIRDILAQYEKHGWNLRRVLLLPETRKTLADELVSLFGETEIILADIDAAWFTRPAANNREAWEIRHLSVRPFALFEAFEYDADQDHCQAVRKSLETRLRVQTSQN